MLLKLRFFVCFQTQLQRKSELRSRRTKKLGAPLFLALLFACAFPSGPERDNQPPGPKVIPPKSIDDVEKQKKGFLRSGELISRDPFYVHKIRKTNMSEPPLIGPVNDDDAAGTKVIYKWFVVGEFELDSGGQLTAGYAYSDAKPREIELEVKSTLSSKDTKKLGFDLWKEHLKMTDGPSEVTITLTAADDETAYFYVVQKALVFLQKPNVSDPDSEYRVVNYYFLNSGLGTVKFSKKKICLFNFTLLPITAILLPRRMIRDVTSQVAVGRFPNWHRSAARMDRAMTDRRLSIHRRRCDIPRLKPKYRPATKRTIHGSLAAVYSPPLCASRVFPFPTAYQTIHGIWAKSANQSSANV